MFDFLNADYAELELRVASTMTEEPEYQSDAVPISRFTRQVTNSEETPDDRADAKETVTRRKLAYALYREDAYTYGAPVTPLHSLPKADLRTYMLKADRIIGFSK